MDRTFTEWDAAALPSLDDAEPEAAPRITDGWVAGRELSPEEIRYYAEHPHERPEGAVPLTDEPLPPLSDDEALGIIRRLARIDDEVVSIQVNAEAMIRVLDRKRGNILATEGERLRQWTAAHLTGKKRSVRTLHGVAGFRTTPLRVTITDAPSALAWARANAPEMIVPKLDNRLLKANRFLLVDGTTGEVRYDTPPGLQVEGGEERFYVKSGATKGDSDA